MKYIAAYLLAVLGGHENPKAADLKKIITSVGVEVDEAQLKKVLKELEGKDINEIIANGSKKLAKFGGAAPAAAAGGAAAGGAAAAEEKKEEVVEEEEVDMAGGMDMFGDDEDY